MFEKLDEINCPMSKTDVGSTICVFIMKNTDNDRD